MQSISKTEFKARALEILRAIEQGGDTVIITNHGTPTLEIKRLRQDTRSPLEQLKGSVVKYDAPTAPISDDDWENA
ncbi:MAG: prevent-host-death protein [Legionellales bacterium]|nr:prevent-host-death protein [Legionellales bacterium]|tara:strand:- start:26713 stop:26940 length:228 start_codon:yes stop_codon:yes gene_type:complete